MNNPAYHIPPNARPIGTPTVVMPTQPGQVMLPGQYGQMPGMAQPGQGVAYVQGQPPQQMAGQFPGQSGRPDLSRPEILQQVMQRQAEAADPQAMAEQANRIRMERLIQETNERAAAQAEQLNQAVTMLSQSSQQQAEFQRQQLAIAQQQQMAQQAAAQAAQRMPWQDPSLDLDPETRITFEESIPVMERVSRRNALLAAHETFNGQVSPQIEALKQQIAQLNTRVESNTQVQAQSFADDLIDLASEHKLDLAVLERQPDWIEFKREISNPFTGTTVDEDLNKALASGQKKDLRTVRQVFKNFVDRKAQQNSQQQDGGNALPPQSGNARAYAADPAMQAGAADFTNSVQNEGAQLEEYRGQLLMGLRKGTIDVATFQTEIAKVETAVQSLINQTQQPN